MSTAPPPPSSAQLAFIEAHTHSSKHRAQIEASERCACFFCFKTFTPAKITAWCDGNQTALCPHCGVDAVLGSSNCQLADGFLRGMHRHYFSYRSK